MGDPFGLQIVSDPIPVPFAEGAWIQVRRLTGREVEAAAAVNRGDVEGNGPRAWPRLLRRMLESAAKPADQRAKDADVLTALRDPLLGYDRYALAAAGLVAWSVPVPLVAILDAAANLTAKQIREAHFAVRQAAVDSLAEEEVEFIAIEVLRRTKPALFHATEEDAEAEQKKLSAAAPAD